MDAKTQAFLDQDDANTATVVRRHRWLIQYVGGGRCMQPGCGCAGEDGPAFAYTVGLFGLAHPELLVFGLDPDTSAHLLNELGDRVLAGEALLPGRLLEFEQWAHRVIPEVVPNPGEVVFAANRFYQRPDEASVPVLQLSYDDCDGRFPWESGYSHPERQPRPGTFHA
jgi:hypothetical protein